MAEEIRRATLAPREASMAEEQAKVRQETRQILNRFGRKRRNLIPILQKVQVRLGYLPREAMLEIQY